MGVLTKPINIPSQDILTYVFPSGVVPSWTVISTTGTDETIEVPQYTDQELLTAYNQYLVNVPVEQATEAAEQDAEATEIVNLLQNSNSNVSLAPTLFTVSGRHYLRKNRWYTGADDFYGYHYYQNNEYAGSGNTPTLEWEHMGLLIPGGRRLGNLLISGRANSITVSDIELYIVLRYPNPIIRWDTGIDSDSEMAFDLVYHDNYANPANGGTPFSGGNMADTRLRKINLDYPVNQDSFFCIYMRPITTSNSIRFFYYTMTLEVY